MNINVVRTAAEFEGMSAKELLAEWPRYFDDPPKSRSNKSYPLRAGAFECRGYDDQGVIIEV